MPELLPNPWFARGPVLRRSKEIAATFARHGLGWLVTQLGLADLVPFERVAAPPAGRRDMHSCGMPPRSAPTTCRRVPIPKIETHPLSRTKVLRLEQKGVKK